MTTKKVPGLKKLVSCNLYEDKMNLFMSLAVEDCLVTIFSMSGELPTQPQRNITLQMRLGELGECLNIAGELSRPEVEASPWLLAC